MGVTKGHGYLKAIQRNIALDSAHPKHHGIKMQAHHLLSQDGIVLSSLGTKLVQFGYEIDALENLVFLPCTLQGACHLGVQPHRGDHSAASEFASSGGVSRRTEEADEENYNDDAHPYSYHRLVASQLKTLVSRMERKCNGKAGVGDVFVEALHDLSQSILMTVYGRPHEARLTSIADHFRLGNKVGCGGVDNVGQHDSASPCPMERNHLRRQRPGQKSETITYSSAKPYVPRPRK